MLVVNACLPLHFPLSSTSICFVGKITCCFTLSDDGEVVVEFVNLNVENIVGSVASFV